jgi:iron-sulfur cluster assembly protein
MTLTLTNTAASEVKKFLEAENVGMDGGLRVRVVPGGCSGFQYAMNIEESPQANDEVVESGGLRVFVDMFSAQYLENVQIDYFRLHLQQPERQRRMRVRQLVHRLNQFRER